MGLTKDFFIILSPNKILNSCAKKWGLKLGAQSVVAGSNIEEMVESVKVLNAHGIFSDDRQPWGTVRMKVCWYFLSSIDVNNISRSAKSNCKAFWYSYNIVRRILDGK